MSQARSFKWMVHLRVFPPLWLLVGFPGGHKPYKMRSTLKTEESFQRKQILSSVDLHWEGRRRREGPPEPLAFDQIVVHFFCSLFLNGWIKYCLTRGRQIVAELLHQKRSQWKLNRFYHEPPKTGISVNREASEQTVWICRAIRFLFVCTFSPVSTTSTQFRT